MLRRVRFFFGVILVLLPSVAFATGVSRGTNNQSNTSLITITIPAVIAIDVESNVTFDFNTYAAPTGPTSCANVFPPGADCVTATYTPSAVTIPASGTAGQIWLAVFSNTGGHQATMDVTAYGDAAFTANPGFTPQAIQLVKGTNNVAVNSAVFGPAAATFIGTSATPLDLHSSGTMTDSHFGWTRIDQTPSLALPGTTTFQTVTGATANITFTIKY